MMHETWISTENYQTLTVFCVDHSLPTLQIRNNFQVLSFVFFEHYILIVGGDVKHEFGGNI